MERFWVPHEELVWTPCWLVSSDAGGYNFSCDDGTNIVIPEAQAKNLDKVQQAQLDGVDNLCKLEAINKAALLHTLRVRYGRKEVYTRVARILIAVNPFQPLSIYSSQYVDEYMKAADSLELEPHVYGIGLDAMHGLRRGDHNQAVLISGESGAGKTESTKLVLAYMAEALMGHDGMHDQVLQTNPILEAFGNAMTVRNNNSSRFGKWLEMSVSPSSKILGCSVTDYLLETTRVCMQGEKERNYHIFFQLIKARNEDDLKSLDIHEPHAYRYLQNCKSEAPGIDDMRCFEELKDAFSTLEFSESLRMDIFRVVVGILLLGNCEFKEEGDHAQITDEKAVIKASEMLGINGETLLKAVTVKKIVVGKEVTESPLKVSGAQAARDSLSRLIYGRMFKWLIGRINKALHDGEKTDLFFGVLDIAGFESFDHNSLEQLFINLSNEHLQQHFNNHIFKMELEDYKSEGITVGADLTYKDNADIVALIGDKGGILPILDEEVTMPKASDQTFVSKVFKAHDKNPRMIVPKFAGAMQFGVQHFAGEVTYQCEGFLEKNIDKPPEDAPAMLKASKLTVLQEVGGIMATELAEASAGPGGRGKKAKTVSVGFRTSLKELMDKLNNAEPHFIRCVKPNAEKVPGAFTSKMVMNQLLFSGVMEAVRIRQQGYASRVPFREFCGRYKVVLPKAVQLRIFGGDADDHAKAASFLEALPSALSAVGGYKYSDRDFILGKTKVLATAMGIAAMDRVCDLAVSGYALNIQRWRRGLVVRRRMRGVKEIFTSFTSWIESNPVYAKPGSEHTAMAIFKTSKAVEAQIKKLNGLLDQADMLPTTLPNAEYIRKIKHRLENELRMVHHLESMQVCVDPVEVDKSLARAKDLDFPRTEVIVTLEERCKHLKVQIPLVKAMQDALEASDLSKLQQCQDEVKKAGLNTKPELWVLELKGMELSGRIYDAIERMKADKKLADIEAKRKAELDESMQAIKSVNENKFTEDEEAKKPKRKPTITGLSIEGQMKLLVALRNATEEYDAVELEERLGEATKQGIEPEQLEDAQDLMAKLQTEAFLMETMKDFQGQVMSDTPPAHALKCLQNLVTQAKRLGIDESIIDQARPVIQQGVRRRARSTIKGSIFDHVDFTELQLGEEVFRDLSNFENLKPMAQWRGHRRGSLLRRISAVGTRGDDGGVPIMLSHSKMDIKEAITKVPSSLETPAVQNFRNLLGWMSDRPVAECQRLGYAQDIVDAAKTETAFADEVYVQVLKQLTKNPSRRSALLGWKLLLLLCQQVRPSMTLEEFIRSFLLRSLKTNDEQGFDEPVVIAKQCITDLNILTKPDANAAGDADDQIIPVQVLLIDNSTRKVYIKQSATLGKLGMRMAEQLKIHHGSDFSFFQLTEGLETHRLLPDVTVLSQISQKWLKLKETTGRTSRLLWKRRFLRVDESLQAGDLIHATLTYRQAVWDYLHYPIAEDQKFLCDTAAALIWIEQDHYMEYIKGSKLGDVGILEQLLPAHSLTLQKRNKWASQIADAFQKMVVPLDPRETRLQKMSRIIVLLQKMKLFGAYFWLGRQMNTEVPAEKVSVPEAPKQNCKINPKEPDAEYWICVDLYGVRFVSSDAAAGTEFQRGFLFNEEAVERVLRWGAKHNVLQFIVQTINPAFPSAGRVPMSIALTSPAAIDIAYAVHCISNHRKSPIRS